MSQSDRAIKKLATQLARLDREVKSWRGAQADYTSVENGGNFTFKDSDGNVTAIVGGQDDGSNTIRHVDGPIPPIPSGLTAHVDGPIVQVSWDGTFEDADEATYDWSHLEVVAVGPNSENLRATISDVTGASVNLAATQSGDWDVFARSVSRAEKRSVDGDAGTFTVELVGLSGAIEDAIGSANGKNTVTYSETPPTPEDEGIVGDTWWVGMEGRPEEVLATNLALNPSFTTLDNQIGSGSMSASNGTAVIVTQDWSDSGDTALKITPTGSATSTAVDQMVRENPATAADAGKTYTISANIHLEDAQTGSLWSHPRRILVRSRYGGLTSSSFAYSQSAPNEPGTHRVSVTFTLQPNTEWWYFLLTNGSNSVPVFWDSITVEEGEGSAQYFDGDTQDGSSDDDPHYRWTGAPHASVSEMFLPAIGSGVWNITEQWQYTSSGWLPVELAHEVIATVDLGKATVGELDGVRIMGKTITSDLFSGDAFDGIVFRGNTFVTRDGNGEFSDRGLFFQKPDGTAIFRVPTDGAPISMSAADVQIQRAQVDELELNVGRVRSGGLFELASGVTPPASPPELNSAWARLTTLQTPTPGLTYDWLGLGYWAAGDAWVRAVNVLGAAGDDLDVVEVYDYESGEFVKSIPTGLNPRSGVTVIGDVAYVMGPDYSKANIGKQWVHGLNLNTGQRVTRWEYVHFFDPKQAKVALGNDGTNLVAAGVAPTRRLHVFRYNPTTGALVSSWQTAPDWPASGGKDLYGVRVSGSDVEVVTSWGGRVYTNSNNTLTRKTDSANGSGYAGWVLPSHDVTGCAWISGLPYPVNSGGNVHKGTPPLSDSSLRATFTWWDGTHETTPAPIAEAGVPAQEDFTVSVPTRPGLSKRVYVEFSSNPGAWYRTTLGESDTTATYSSFGSSRTTLPTTNSFPNADPAIFRSTNGNVVVRGDGSGVWGPLTFNADGTMTSSQIPEWIPVTTFTSGFGAHTFGYAPAYRIWPDGKVEWRGVIGGAFSATVDPFTVPVAARPAQSVNVAIASNQSGSRLRRAEFLSTAAPTMLRVYSAEAAGTWASLDNVSYYLT